MVVVPVVIHPRGLHPMEAVRAWQLHREEGLPLTEVRAEVQNLAGGAPSVKAVWSAVQRVSAMRDGDLLPSSRYENCGRKEKLSKADVKRIISFVKEWRNKRFCTCGYVKTALRLQVSNRTICNVLNRNGFFWRALPRVRGFSAEELRKRKAWIDQHMKYPR